MILDKAKMAHDYAIEMLKRGDPERRIAFDAWTLADAMQAEADKREKEEAAQKRKEIREMLNAPNTFVEREGQHFDDVEWQPDWSQAPEWANWWCITNIGSALFYDEKPRVFNNGFFGSTCCHAPTFDYQGNWQDSLRKRPQ